MAVILDGKDVPFDSLKKGDIIRVQYGIKLKDRGRDGPFHVRGFVDDRIVFRWYGRHKQWWHYRIEDNLWWDVVVKDRAQVERGRP